MLEEDTIVSAAQLILHACRVCTVYYTTQISTDAAELLHTRVAIVAIHRVK
jgi:hypothetical protein